MGTLWPYRTMATYCSRPATSVRSPRSTFKQGTSSGAWVARPIRLRSSTANRLLTSMTSGNCRMETSRYSTTTAPPIIQPPRAVSNTGSTNPAKTVTELWNYTAPSVFATYMGNTQRLADGNTLLSWGAPYTKGGYVYRSLTEVAPDNRILLELTFDQPYVSYRAFMFPWHGYPDTRPALAFKVNGDSSPLDIHGMARRRWRRTGFMVERHRGRWG